jgi:hypothetical protein
VLLDPLEFPVVKVVLTVLLEVTEKEVVTMHTERRTKLPLANSDPASVASDEVPLEQSKGGGSRKHIQGEGASRHVELHD